VIPGGKSTFYAGTKLFFSPEIVQRIPYDLEKNTVWQLGCLLYVLYFNQNPFYDTYQILSDMIETHLLRYELRNYPQRSIELIAQMLAKFPKDRPYLHEIFFLVNDYWL
jgi:serine/threonine protein kinase